MAVRITLRCPDQKEVERWIDRASPGGEKLDAVVRRLALECEGTLKTEFTAAARQRTGATRASIGSRLIVRTPTSATYGVGSQVRGHVLRWIDRGRGWVFPRVRTVLRWFTPGGEVLYRPRAGPTRPTGVMSRSGEITWQKLDRIVKEVMG